MGARPAMGVVHSTPQADCRGRLEISPSLQNELGQIGIRHQKMLEHQALEAHFAQEDAQSTKSFESIREAEVSRLVSAIEDKCFGLGLRPAEKAYPCDKQKEDCLRCFATSGDLLQCAKQLEAFKACSEAS